MNGARGSSHRGLVTRPAATPQRSRRRPRAGSANRLGPRRQMTRGVAAAAARRALTGRSIIRWNAARQTVHRLGGPGLLDLAVAGDAVRAVAEADERDHVAAAGADEKSTLDVVLMHTHCRARPARRNAVTTLHNLPRMPRRCKASRPRPDHLPRGTEQGRAAPECPSVHTSGNSVGDAVRYPRHDHAHTAARVWGHCPRGGDRGFACQSISRRGPSLQPRCVTSSRSPTRASPSVFISAATPTARRAARRRHRGRGPRSLRPGARPPPGGRRHHRPGRGAPDQRLKPTPGPTEPTAFSAGPRAHRSNRRSPAAAFT